MCSQVMSQHYALVYPNTSNCNVSASKPFPIYIVFLGSNAFPQVQHDCRLSRKSLGAES